MREVRWRRRLNANSVHVEMNKDVQQRWKPLNVKRAAPGEEGAGGETDDTGRLVAFSEPVGRVK